MAKYGKFLLCEDKTWCDLLTKQKRNVNIWKKVYIKNPRKNGMYVDNSTIEIKKTIKKTLKVRFSWTFCFLLRWLLLWGRIFNTQSLTLQYNRRRIKCRSWYPQIFKELQVEPKLGAWPTYEYVSSFPNRFCRRQSLRIAQTWNYWKVARKLQYFF